MTITETDTKTSQLVLLIAALLASWCGFWFCALGIAYGW